jgi:small subunit ribosomal protein S17
MTARLESPAVRERRTASRIGVVTKNKMDKSVIVRVDRTMQHEAYERFVRRTSQFMAHDESNACKVGDTVEIVQCRPLSARKRWRVRRILRSGVGVETLAVDEGSSS